MQIGGTVEYTAACGEEHCVMEGSETPAGIWPWRAHTPLVRVRVRVRVPGLVMLAYS